jgi:streptomycin 6-kinase
MTEFVASVSIRNECSEEEQSRKSLMTMPSRDRPPTVGSALARLHQFARAWNVDVDVVVHARLSLVAYGSCGDRLVVLKVLKEPGDEWWSGEVASAFDARGMARVYEHAGGAMLLERLRPGQPLTRMAISESDEQATSVLACVVAAMSPGPPPRHAPSVEQWVDGFDRYVLSGDRRIGSAVVANARDVFVDLARSQRTTRLLHGDLQHSNVLLDADRGWVAIDPKGVIGEVEYELGAMLRNPSERPDLYTDPVTIERRVDQLASELSLDRRRIVGWAFAQAVLSAIWEIEDGGSSGPTHPSLVLARALRGML